MSTFFSLYKAKTIFQVFVDVLQRIFFNVAQHLRNFIQDFLYLLQKVMIHNTFQISQKSSQKALDMAKKEATKSDRICRSCGLGGFGVNIVAQ